MSGNLQKSLLKVVVLGDAGVGKTSIVKQYVEHKYEEEYKPTIGADFLTKDMTLPGRGNITLQIWDTAGQERFKSMAVSFYRGADACVLCYDITDPKSFQNLEMWMQEFSENAGTEIDKAKFPFIVLGNKADKDESDRQISKDRAEAWCKSKHNIPIFETSAVTKLNLEEAFDVIAQAAGRGESIPSVQLTNVKDMDQKDEEEEEEAVPDEEEKTPEPASQKSPRRGKTGNKRRSSAQIQRHTKTTSRRQNRLPKEESPDPSESSRSPSRSPSPQSSHRSSRQRGGRSHGSRGRGGGGGSRRDSLESDRRGGRRGRRDSRGTIRLSDRESFSSDDGQPLCCGLQF